MSNSIKNSFNLLINILLMLAPIIISSLALAGALYLQHAHNAQPCALCILQRYAYSIILFFGCINCFFVLMFGKRYIYILRATYIIIILFALLGIAASVYHLWILAHPSIKCGKDLLEIAINNFYLAQKLPAVFLASGFCFDKFASILGLTLPVWSLLGLLGILMSGLFFLKQDLSF